jgi:hypothetical protein
MDRRGCTDVGERWVALKSWLPNCTRAITNSSHKFGNPRGHDEGLMRTPELQLASICGSSKTARFNINISNVKLGPRIVELRCVRVAGLHNRVLISQSRKLIHHPKDNQNASTLFPARAVSVIKSNISRSENPTRFPNRIIQWYPLGPSSSSCNLMHQRTLFPSTTHTPQPAPTTSNLILRILYIYADQPPSQSSSPSHRHGLVQ